MSESFVISGIFFVLLVVAIFLFENRNSKVKQLQYRYFAKSHIMTKREEKLFVALNSFFGDQCYVIPQVHLSALLEHRVKGQNWKGAFSHINGKSVDFVLLQRKSLKIACAIELDDSTHDMENRIKRDREVEKIFESVKIPLIRLRTPTLNREVIERFRGILSNI